MPAILSPPHLRMRALECIPTHKARFRMNGIGAVSDSPPARFQPQPNFFFPLYDACLWFSLLEPRCSQSRLEVRCLAASATSRTPNCSTRMGSSCLGKCAIVLQKMTWVVPRRFRSSRSTTRASLLCSSCCCMSATPTVAHFFGSPYCCPGPDEFAHPRFLA